MGLTNFRAIDFEKDGSAVKVARSKRDRVQAAAPAPDAVVEDPNAVPAGTVPEVLAWVGEDTERASKALEVELQDSKPRKGLVEKLNDLVDSAEEEEEAVEDDKSDDSDDDSESTEE